MITRCFCLLMLIAGFNIAPVLSGIEDVYSEISLAIKSGNAKEISKFFSTNVELTIIDNEDLYSKAQAEQILKDFFEKYKPKDYKLVHQGSSNEGSKYAIGNYVAENGMVFRTYFYIKLSEKTYFIQELRIEKEEE